MVQRNRWWPLTRIENICSLLISSVLNGLAVESMAIAKEPTLHVSYSSLILLGKDLNNETVTRQLGCESRKKIDLKLPFFSLSDSLDIEAAKCPNGYRPTWDFIQPFPREE